MKKSIISSRSLLVLLVLLITILSIALLMAGCTITIREPRTDKDTEPTPPIETDPPEETPRPTPEPDPPPTQEPDMDLGIQIVEAGLYAARSGSVYAPYDSDIVFSINNTIDGSVQIQEARGVVCVFELKFDLASPFSGSVRFVMTAEDGSVYERENDANFDRTGENSFISFVRLAEAASGEYQIEVYFDGKLAFTDAIEAVE